MQKFKKNDWAKVISTKQVVQIIKYKIDNGALLRGFLDQSNPDDTMHTNEVICLIYNNGQFERKTFNENELEPTDMPT